jgi:hypothetical protein
LKLISSTGLDVNTMAWSNNQKYWCIDNDRSSSWRENQMVLPLQTDCHILLVSNSLLAHRLLILFNADWFPD